MENNYSAEEQAANLAEKMMESAPIVWGQLFFPHHFRMKSPGFHYTMISSAIKHQRLAVAAPRESAKSTILVFLYPFHQIIFKKKRFILIVSNTFKKAAMHLDSIKKELAENELFKKSFKGLTFVRDAEGDTIFRHADGFQTLVLCKGVDQIGSVRGVKFGAYRPDLILCDDIEDDELVRNIERRVELHRNYDEALVPAGEKGNCQFIAVGTILHDDCQLAKLVSKDHYPEYFKLFFKARQDDGTSLWPEKWSLDYLNQLEKDKPTVFAKEYQNDPVAGSNTRFKREDFRYWKYSPESSQRVLLLEGNEIIASYAFSELRSAISCDLAWKEKRESDSSVIMPGFITPNSEILVDTYVTKKGMRPDELSNQLFIMVERLERLTGAVVPIGFEKAMLENVSQWLLKREMQKRNKFLLIKELVWDSDKNTRIETRLQPRYAQHVMFHRQGMGDLEHQLERFPYGAHDDLCDAEQALCQLLQNPKPKEKYEEQEDSFMRVRQFMIDSKTKPRQEHRYPARRQSFPYPVHRSVL